MVSNDLIKELVAAGMGCALADSIFNPLEIVKVRLQVKGGNGSVISISRVYEELLHIYEHEGVLQLWTPGLVPTILRGFLYSGFRIGMYPTIRGLINDRFDVPAAERPTGGSTRDSLRGGDSLFVTKLIAGGLCGAAGSFIFSPLDLVRIKFQRDPSAYPSTGSAFRFIYSEGGLKGLWQGSSATVARATMLSACQLSIYDQIKSLATSVRAGDSGGEGREVRGERGDREGERGGKWYMSWLEEGPLLHAAASLLSGVIAQGVIMPVDVIKTKMMATVSGSGSSSASSGRPMYHSSSNGGRVALTMIGAGALIWREGGIGGFYRGFVPALMRQGPCILIQMPLIEQLRRLFGLEYL